MSDTNNNLNTSSSSSPSPLNKKKPLITQDGQINYPCSLPFVSGGLFGAAAGGMWQYTGGGRLVPGVLGGSISCGAAAAARCFMLRQRGGTIYDESFDRTITFACTGATFPPIVEITNIIAYKAPPTPPKIMLLRMAAYAGTLALCGLLLDWNGWGVPKRPDAAQQQQQQ